MSTVQHEGDLLAGVDDDAVVRDPGPPALLIASDRVEGTAVFDASGERIGTIKRFLVEKRSGKAQYAEMEFGGLFGIGADIRPLPWEALDYVPEKGGYVVALPKERLADAPRYAEAEQRTFDDAYCATVRKYYGVM